MKYIESYHFPIHSLADQSHQSFDALTKAMRLNAGILCMKKADFFLGRKEVLLLMAEILHQLRLVVCPIIYKVLYIPGGCLGFQPSTVRGRSGR